MLVIYSFFQIPYSAMVFTQFVKSLSLWCANHNAVAGNLLSHPINFSETLLKILLDALWDLHDNWYFFGVVLGIETASLDVSDCCNRI